MRWREELVATSEEGKLVFECTIAGFHVYFPSKTRWEGTAPEWAKPQWEVYYNACMEWCAKNRIPISLEDDGHMYEEK